MTRETDTGAADDTTDALFNQSLARGMGVLEAFRGADRPLSLAQIAARAGLSRSAAQRLVHTLRKLGYLTLSGDGHGFLLSLPVLDLTHDYLRLNPLLRRASPFLLELRQQVRERVDLSLFDGARMVYAHRLQSKREAFFATLVGNSVPSTGTSGGWAALALLPDPEIDAILAAAPLPALTPRSLTDPDAIRAEIARVRRDGHALAVEQVLMGEVAVGMAIPDAAGRPAGAIHVAGSLAEWSPEAFRRHVVPPLAQAIANIGIVRGGA